MDVTVSNNDLSVNTASGFGLSGLDLTAGAVPGDTGTLCVNVVANNIAFIGDPGFWGAQAQTVAGTPTILLEGYGGAANNTAQINAFLNTRATTVNPPAQSFVSAGTIAAAPRPAS